jgi:hypothetical protein
VHGRLPPIRGGRADLGAVRERNAVVPQRPRAAVVAPRLAIAGSALLLGSVVVLLVPVLTGSVADRWSTALGAVLTCTLAGLGLAGARALARGTGRTLLLTAAWVQGGVLAVVLGAVGVDVVGGLTSGSTALVVLVGGGGGLALAAGTVVLAGRRDVGGWLSATTSWRALAPRSGRVDRVTLALLVPVALLAVGTAAAAALVPGSVEHATADATGTAALGPASPPPAATDPGWQAEFAPQAEDCASGSMTACDDLYWQSSVGDVYERYGSTCGGRLPDEVEGACVRLFGRTLG